MGAPREPALEGVAASMRKHAKGYNTLDIMKALQRALTKAPEAISSKDKNFTSSVQLEQSAAIALSTFEKSAAMSEGLNQLCNNIHTVAAELAKKDDKAAIGDSYDKKGQSFRERAIKLSKQMEDQQKNFLAKLAELHARMPEIMQRLGSKELTRQQFLTELEPYKAEFTRAKLEIEKLIREQNALWNEVEPVARASAQEVIGEGIRIPKVDRPVLGA